MSADESASTCFPLLASVVKLRAAANGELATQITRCLSAGRVPQYPPLHLATLLALVERLCAPASIAANQQQQAGCVDPALVYFDSMQVRMLVASFIAAAAKAEGFMIQGWFSLSTEDGGAAGFPADEASGVASIVSLLLGALEDEQHCMAVGETFRLLLQNSPQVIQAFVAYRAPYPFAPPTLPSGGAAPTAAGVSSVSSGGAGSTHQQQQQQYNQQLQLHQQSFAATAVGVIAPFLTDNSALRGYAAWQILMAALQPDPSTPIPPRELVELLAKHVHAYIEMIVTCMRHANPACRRFALRVLSDTLQVIRAWNPIATCLLQSPAVFFSILANSEGPPVPEHWPCYQIIKMFISLPSKCPLMRHLCYTNRDALAEYVQLSAMRYGLNFNGETKFLLSRLDAMTPLTAEEAALIHCSI